MSLPPNRNLFKEHPNRVFVETGSYRGDGIAAAMEAGFEKIISIDIDPQNIQFCVDRFDMVNFPDRAKLYVGDSGERLGDFIAEINEPITFWLDAHSQLFEGEEDNFPLLKELEQISRHPIKTHTIIIDDMLVMTHPDVTGWTWKFIENALRKINPEYKLQYVANPVKNNILIAYL